jgi:hypothetical protein
MRVDVSGARQADRVEQEPRCPVDCILSCEISERQRGCQQEDPVKRGKNSKRAVIGQSGDSVEYADEKWKGIRGARAGVSRSVLRG